MHRQQKHVIQHDTQLFPQQFVVAQSAHLERADSFLQWIAKDIMNVEVEL